MFHGRLLRGAAGVCVATFLLSAPAAAQEIESIHFLIPGGAGGGWDGTARGTGEALTKAGLIGNASFENMSGGGGGKALSHFIETAEKQQGTLMVQSTPIVMRSLQKSYAYTYEDVTPVAGLIGDYGAFFVKADSPIESFGQLIAALEKDPAGLAIGGGSLVGGMDHIVAAMVLKAAGTDAGKFRYVPYDAGGKAMAGLLSGEIDALSEQVSTAGDLDRQGQVRILCITSEERLADKPEVPTCREEGADATFVNWRGFFGPPGMSDAERDTYVALFEQMYETAEWEEVRARNSWVNIFNPGDEFRSFMNEQAESLGEVMRELGFL
ncbi:MAG TPA: tripartite tricarboxylate transporter substrate binding protein [Kiloniellaceae bacterium]|nr:tripartite tricarboxylate transporter substrate binding protein [Kiloniellaceae bacterium]HIP77164.1 tripartite tricarboxylate transporter substrate binding protein [Kiloniellaceae bacterium]